MSFLKVKPKGGRKVHLVEEASNDAQALCGAISRTGWFHVSVPVTCTLCQRESTVRMPKGPLTAPPPELELELQGEPQEDDIPF